MHRLTTVLLMVPAIALLSGDARRHVHVYGDHDHFEHRHGLASHEHHDEVGVHEGALHIDECEPGEHVLRIGVACSHSLYADAVMVDSAIAPVIDIAPRTVASVELTDVRAHGPPPFAQRPLRAPPLASA